MPGPPDPPRSRFFGGTPRPRASTPTTYDLGGIAGLLRDIRPLALCDACLALKVSLSLEAARDVMMELKVEGIASGPGTCSVCGREKLVVTAAG